MFVLLFALLAPLANAQTSAPNRDPTVPVLGSNWHVWLVTFGPGEEVYEQFGHDAICFYDDQTRNGVAYDWGRFDFKQPNFIGRFIKGRMLYSMGDAELNPMLVDYTYGADRDLWRQELNLTAQQKAKLFTICETGMLPENRNYRYDYYKANCATKTRDALDEALGGQIKRQLAPEQTDKTYRWHTLTQVQPFRLIAAGLDLAMAQPTDVKLSAWDEAFLPHTLQEHLRLVTVLDESGRVAPLVLSE